MTAFHRNCMDKEIIAHRQLKKALGQDIIASPLNAMIKNRSLSGGRRKSFQLLEILHFLKNLLRHFFELLRLLRHPLFDAWFLPNEIFLSASSLLSLLSSSPYRRLRHSRTAFFRRDKIDGEIRHVHFQHKSEEKASNSGEKQKDFLFTEGLRRGCWNSQQPQSHVQREYS